MKKVFALVLAILATGSIARAEPPPLLALPRPGLLGSYIFQPLPVGLLTWQSTDSAPGLLQSAQTSDVATHNLTITSGAPYASASTNLIPGNVQLVIPAPVGAGANGFAQVKIAGTLAVSLGEQVGGTSPALYLGTSAPTAANYAEISDGTNLFLNAAGSGTIHIRAANGTDFASFASGAITFGQPTTENSTLAVSGAITHPSPQTIACGTGGTQTVAANPTSGFIVTSGTLGSNCTIDFSTNATSGDFTLDMSGVTLGASFGVIFKNGTTSSPTFTSGSVITTGDTLAKVWTHGANTLAVQY